MSLLIRRSNLLFPMNDAGAVDNAWRHNADAITLAIDGKLAADAVTRAIASAA